MEFPRYAIVGARPVVAVKGADGSVDVLAFDWSSGELVRDMGMMSKVLFPETHDETDLVSEQDFDAYVAALREDLAARKAGGAS